MPLAREKQLPPEGDWRIWLILAGRGFGKTRSIAEWAIEQARRYPGSRGALVARIASDNRDVLVEGESGILNVASPAFRPKYEPSKRRLTFPNGSIATTYSADEPNTLRGPQHHWAICDELAAWSSEEAWDNLLMGLRLGEDPRVAIATTPRPTPLIRSLLIDPTVTVVRGSTYENADNLAPAFFTGVVRRYEGTRLGRQELNAEILEDVEGALWKLSHIEDNRIQEFPLMTRIVVGVDPPGGATECGIVVAGMDARGHGYVLADMSLQASPEQWATEVVRAHDMWEADCIVVEINFGGDMVKNTLRAVPNGKLPRIKEVRASRGKAIRAEPVSARYEQGEVHHIARFPRLEDEMCNWVPNMGMSSPNRVDALVWAMTELMGKERREARSFQG